MENFSSYRAHKVKLLTKNVKNRNKSAIFFFPAIIELVRELVISNMHNKFEKDTWKTFQVIAPTRSNYWSNVKNRHKSAILNFFSAIIELVREVVISNMQNKFGKETWKTFQVIAPTSKC